MLWKMKDPVIVIAIGVLLLASQATAANFSYETMHILTVCDIFTIEHTRANQSIPQCANKAIPDTTIEEFFNTASKALWDMPCDDTSNDEPLIRKPTVWDRSIRAMHWLLGEVQKKIAAFGWFVKGALDDVSRFSVISNKWSWFWVFVLWIIVSIFFFVQGLYLSRPGRMKYYVILNMLIASGIVLPLSIVHLYFGHYFKSNVIYVMGFFLAICMLAKTPWYPKIGLSGIGIMVGMQLIVPLIGFVILIVFKTALFFGPVLSLCINVGGLLIHILCLMALFLDEKLVLVKVFLLPLYRKFQDIFGLSEKNEETVAQMRRNAENLTAEIFNTFEAPPPEETSTIEQMDRAFTKALRSICVKKVTEWENECWYFIRDRCKEETWNAGAMPYIIGWVACPKVAYKVCPGQGSVPKVNLDEYCNPTDSAFGVMYKSFNDSINALAREIVIDPMNPKVNGEILERTAGFDLFAAKWTWWVRHIISWSFSGFWIAVFLSALVYAIVFLVKYRRNPYFSNDYLSRSLVESWNIKLSRREKRKFYWNFTRFVYDYVTVFVKYPSRFFQSFRLLGAVLLNFTLEQSAKFLHDELEKIQFRVPNYGEARFIFNIQGEGFFASLIRSVLGGFSLQSKFCKIADSSVCDTAFIPVTWQTWLMLFLLAWFYFFIGIYESRSDYIMCRICDFLIPEQGEKRAQVVLEDVLDERRKRSIVVQTLAKEEIEKPVSIKEENDVILSFYLPRRWYHRFMPNIMLSTWAYCRFGVDNIFCQICYQNIISARFRCKNILFCDECRLYLKECPCGGDECIDGMKFDV